MSKRVKLVIQHYEVDIFQKASGEMSLDLHQAQFWDSSVSRSGSIFWRSKRVWGRVAVACDALDWKSRAPGWRCSGWR